MTPEQARQAARDAAWDGDWDVELGYLEIFLKAHPTDESALTAAAIAECYQRRPDQARAYAFRLPRSSRAYLDTVKMCSGQGVDLPLPDAAAAPTDPRRNDFTAAIDKHRCYEAAKIAKALGDAALGKQADTCDQTRKNFFQQPLDTDGEAWVLAWVDEERAIAPDPRIPSSLLENYYLGRATAACQQHLDAIAREAYGKMTVDKAKVRVQEACTSKGITLK